MISDFVIAQQMYESENTLVKQVFSSLSYFFIALPGIMILYRQIISVPRFKGKKIEAFLGFLVYLTLFIVTKLPPRSFLPFSYLVSALILSVGILDTFCHGPQINKLSAVINGYEGLYESVPQMVIQLILLFAGEVEWDTTSIYSVCSSFLMLGKDLAEEIILKSHISQSLSFLTKIVEMVKVIPVIVLISFFIISSIALVYSHFVFFLDFHSIWMLKCFSFTCLYQPFSVLRISFLS